MSFLPSLPTRRGPLHPHRKEPGLEDVAKVRILSDLDAVPAWYCQATGHATPINPDTDTMGYSYGRYCKDEAWLFEGHSPDCRLVWIVTI